MALRKMKRMALWAAGVTVVTASLGLGPAAATAMADQKVTLTYGMWDKNQVPAIKAIITAFEKTHPNITVKIVLTPWNQYWTKLQTEAQGGTLQDIFWMNAPNFQRYASNNMLMPLGSRLKASGMSLNNYPQSLDKLYTYNGEPYGIPKDFDTIGLFYNKALFKAAHVKTPDSTWNWSTLISAAKKLTNQKKGIYGIAAVETSQEGYYNTIFQNGGYVISPDGKKSGYDNPATIGGIKFWTDLINVYHASPTLQQLTDTDPWSMFVSGKIAMIYGGSWNVAMLKQSQYALNNIDVTVLPQGKKRATVIHGLGNVIAANTKHPQEAWEFEQFLGSKEAALIQANSGTVIPAYKGTQSAWVQSVKQFHLQIFLDELNYAIPYPISKETAKWQDVEPQYFNKAWTGQQTAQQAADAMAQQMNGALSQEH